MTQKGIMSDDPVILPVIPKIVGKDVGVREDRVVRKLGSVALIKKTRPIAAVKNVDQGCLPTRTERDRQKRV